MANQAKTVNLNRKKIRENREKQAEIIDNAKQRIRDLT